MYVFILDSPTQKVEVNACESVSCLENASRQVYSSSLVTLLGWHATTHRLLLATQQSHGSVRRPALLRGPLNHLHFKWEQHKD